MRFFSSSRAANKYGGGPSRLEDDKLRKKSINCENAHFRRLKIGFGNFEKPTELRVLGEKIKRRRRIEKKKQQQHKNETKRERGGGKGT